MIELIPAIDIIGGRCVRLQQGRYEAETLYHPDPAKVAQNLESLGIQRLHLVDLDGAKKGRVVNLEVLRRITDTTRLIVDFGGGLQSKQDVASVFSAGAEMVTLGSLAVRDPRLFMEFLNEYGAERIILGADARDRRISIQGWQEDTDLDLVEFIANYQERGIRKLICTDISRDGMLTGPALSLYRELRSGFPSMEIIASGGVKDMEDIRALNRLRINGVIFGKAFFEGKIGEAEIADFLQTQ